MALFQEAIIKKHLLTLDAQVLDSAYNEYKRVYSPEKIKNIRVAKEEQYQEGFIKEIFGSVLGYSVYPESPFNIETEKKNETNARKADGAILSGEKVVGVIELKDNKTKNLDAVKDQAFGYKNNHKDCSYVISSNFHKLRFYIDDATDYEEFDLYNLDKETFKRFYLYLRKEGLLDKNLPKLLRQETKFHEEEISKKLYKDYSNFKRRFFENAVQNNPQHDKLELFKKSQKFLDRILFLLFAEDKGLVGTNSIVSIVEKWSGADDDYYQPLYEMVNKYFGHLYRGYTYQKTGEVIPQFGGELFAPDELLESLKIDDEVLKNDLLILSKYDFNTDVDVNILGHIFEHSLNEVDDVEAELRGETLDKSKSKRKKDGVFYTPKYITKYIVDNTLGKLCNEKKIELKLDEDIAIFEYQKADGKLNEKGKELFERLNTYKSWLLTLKVCDPACGSGAFLNQALSYFIEEHKFVDDIIAELTNTPLRLFDTDLQILENNIFGVDINEESVEIAKLSMWLRTAQPGRKLSDLSNNIKCGNSLIDDPAVAGDKAFNWQKEFPTVFAKGGFDVVIGNPPYGAKISEHDRGYITNKYLELDSSDLDTYLVFYLQSIGLLEKNGLLGFITPDTYLTISRAQGLRTFFYKNSQIIDIHDWYKPFADAKDTRCNSLILRNNKSVDYSFHVSVTDSKGKITKDFFLDSSILSNPASWNLYISPTDRILYDKMINNSYPLKTFCKIKYGLRTGDNEKYLTADLNLSDLGFKIARGSNIERYYFNWTPEYLKTQEGLPTSYFEDEIINSPKIIIQYVRTNSTDPNCRWLEAALIEEDGFVPLNSTSFLYKGSTEINLKCLLAIISSTLLNKFYKDHYTDVNVKPLYLGELPIPKKAINSADKIINAVDKAILNKKQIHQIEDKFSMFLENSLGLQNSNSSSKWLNFEFPEFLKKLAKTGCSLSKKDEFEWMELFEENKKKVFELKTQIDQTDKEIDRMVYELYGLTEEEIQIVENS
jgi:hypothetical protein